MIEINLLPEGMRKQRRNLINLDFEVGKFKMLMGCVGAGSLIFLVVVLSLGSFIRKKQILALTVREQAIMPQYLEAEKVNSQISRLKTKMSALDEHTKRGFLWAEKLNQLSDLVLPGIWFTRIYTASGNRLILEGSVISKKEEAMALVGKFMKDVRDSKAFFKDYNNIKLESVQRKSIYERDVVDFRIALYFKDYERY